MLPKTLPDLKVISSLMTTNEENLVYLQTFREAEDGIIEVPRVVSGYYLHETSRLVLLSELFLHYINSHYIHPDDIVEPIRSEGRTWDQMYAQLSEQVRWLHDNAPNIRPMTASEAGAAVQRYHRLQINAVLDKDTYTVHLGNFYDEAWFILRTNRPPIEMTGGSFTRSQ